MTISASTYLGFAMVLMVALILIGSSFSHTRGSRLKEVLAEQNLVPARLIAPLALLVPATELTVAAVMIVGLLTGGAPRVVGTVASLGLMCSYTGYQAVLLRTRSGTPCGCSATDDVPVSGWTLLRAVLLAIGAACGFLEADLTPAEGADLGIFALTAIGLGLILWFLPTAVTGGLATRGGVRWDLEWKWR